MLEVLQHKLNKYQILVHCQKLQPKLSNKEATVRLARDFNNNESAYPQLIVTRNLHLG